MTSAESDDGVPLLPYPQSSGERAPNGSTFFVSANGDDGNLGTSADAPWRTLGRAMTEDFAAGDLLLLERGGTFFGQIRKTPRPSTGLRWTIGAYGSGPQPVVSGYKILDQAARWEALAGSIWRIDITEPAAFSGNTSNTSWNIGHLRVGEDVFGVLRESTSALTGQWEFHCAAPYLYVYSAQNPTVAAVSAGGLRAAPDGPLINVRSNTEILDLNLTGTGGTAITSLGEFVDNVRVAGNTIHHVGGSVLTDQGNVRYGNGVEAWIPSNGWVVENNHIYECYDVALTCQGNQTYGLTISDITFRRNVCHHNSQSIEFWSSGNPAIDGTGFFRILVESNIFSWGGYGWGGPVRPNQDLRCQIWTGFWELPTDIKVQGNTFNQAFSFYRFSYPQRPVGLICQRNDIRLSSGTRMEFLEPETINDAQSWASRESVEFDSTFTVFDGS